MERRNLLTKIIAVAGAVLVWFPIAFTLLTSVVGTIADRAFRLDYLMPAELFPVAVVGSLLLLIAALRIRRYRGRIGWSLAVMALSLAGGQVLTVKSGLASGAVEAAGFVFGAVVASLVLYTVLLVEICVLGLLLLKNLFAKRSA
ncbi:MAG TPA: hypothetical protein PK597_07180 [Oscillospiraceae bacterium]|nr:hypothetical protein [Oscillospiraceae bacterium]